MFSVLFCIVFTIILVLANIYCFKTKKYLNLFIPCMLFLPDYYGIEILDKFPIITATRIMFVIFFLYAWKNRRRSISIKNIHFGQIPKEVMLFLGYSILRIISNLYYITLHAQASKTILSILFEQSLLVFAIYLLAPTRDEINKLIKVIVDTALVLFIVGLFESLTSIRPFDSLYTVSRDILNDHYLRLGLLRSTTTMGLPGLYGNMCLFMAVLIIYLINITQKKRYLFVFALDILAIIHSGSRSDIMFIIFVVVIYGLLFIRTKDRLLCFVKRVIAVIGLICMLIIPIMASSPLYRYYYVSSVKAVLNEFGAHYDLDDNKPEGVEGFGKNGNSNGGGSSSRLVQFTGIIYTLERHPIVGLGTGAESRKDLHYYWNNTWYICHAYDVGLVEIMCNEGLLGLVAHILLFIAIVIRIIVSNNKHIKYLFLYLLTYLISTLSTANMYPFLMIFVSLVFRDVSIGYSHPINNKREVI